MTKQEIYNYYLNLSAQELAEERYKLSVATEDEYTVLSHFEDKLRDVEFEPAIAIFRIFGIDKKFPFRIMREKRIQKRKKQIYSVIEHVKKDWSYDYTCLCTISKVAKDKLILRMNEIRQTTMGE